MVIPNGQLTLDPPKPLQYAFCSDTQYAPATAKYIAGADVVYHEATFLADEKKRAKKTSHSTASQAAKVASEAKARLLLLGHFSARYKTFDAFVEEALPIFRAVKNCFTGLQIEVSPTCIDTFELLTPADEVIKKPFFDGSSD